MSKGSHGFQPWEENMEIWPFAPFRIYICITCMFLAQNIDVRIRNWSFSWPFFSHVKRLSMKISEDISATLWIYWMAKELCILDMGFWKPTWCDDLVFLIGCSEIMGKVGEKITWVSWVTASRNVIFCLITIFLGLKLHLALKNVRAVHFYRYRDSA